MSLQVSRPSALTRVYIYLDGTDIDTVSPETRAHVLEVGHFAGGRRTDFASFELFYAVSTDVGPLQDLDLRSEVDGHLCQVTVTSMLPQPQYRQEVVIHYGRIQAVDLVRSPSGESLVYHSRLTDNMFGVVVYGPETVKQYDSGTYTATCFGQPLIFNPVVDEQVIPNMSAWQRNRGDPGDGENKKYHVFTHVDSIPRKLLVAGSLEEMEAYGFVSKWTLKEAVKYLLWTLNADETHISNPTDAHLRNVFDDPDDVVGVEIPVGASLPEALDHLLEPFGVIWFVDLFAKDIRQFQFARQSAPVINAPIPMQRYGQYVEYVLDQVEELNLSFDITEHAADRVTVFGEVPLREVTTRLYPAWPESKDTTSLEELSSDAAKRDPDLVNVWRKWAMNEAGDYDGMRKRNYQDPRVVDAAMRRWFGGVYSEYNVRRRRRFHPMLTMDAQGQPIGKGTRDTLVEYYEPDSKTWRPIDQLDGVSSYQVLDDEMAIYINSQTPPHELYHIGGDSVMLRITACVEGDSACEEVASATYRLLKDWRDTVVSMPHRFVDNRIHNESQFYNTQTYTLASTNLEEMEQLAEKLVLLWNKASLSGAVVMEGLDWALPIGARISSLGQRLIPTTVTPISQPDPYYPMVIGVRYRIDTQQVVLHLDTIRETVV